MMDTNGPVQIRYWLTRDNIDIMHRLYTESDLTARWIHDVLELAIAHQTFFGLLTDSEYRTFLKLIDKAIAQCTKAQENPSKQFEELLFAVLPDEEKMILHTEKKNDAILANVRKYKDSLTRLKSILAKKERMTDEDENILRKQLPPLGNNQKAGMDKLLIELRTYWSFMFCSANNSDPIYCQHGKTTDGRGLLLRLIESWGTLDDYERGCIFHSFKGLTSHTSKEILDIMARFEDILAMALKLLDEDGETIKSISGQKDCTRIIRLVRIYEHHYGRKAAATTNGPFTRFASSILERRIRITGKEGGQPFRRALEKVKNEDVVWTNKYLDQSYIFTPSGISFSGTYFLPLDTIG